MKRFLFDLANLRFLLWPFAKALPVALVFHRWYCTRIQLIHGVMAEEGELAQKVGGVADGEPFQYFRHRLVTQRNRAEYFYFPKEGAK